MSAYLHDWENGTAKDVLSDFAAGQNALDGANVIVASYTYEDYSGDAYVLFERDGKLFENYGGHCSCYGLEGQWEPEETTKEAILHRINEGRWGRDGSDTADAIRAALAE
jgi:hypothetical protein